MMSKVELTIEHALLGFLRQAPMHGYEISQRMSDANGLAQVWAVKQSRLYGLLARLEKEGYIAATLEVQASRPPRKVFHLTPLGEETYLRWVESPVPHGRQIRLHFLVKLYFALLEGPGTASRLLLQQRLSCENWLARLQESARQHEQNQQFPALVYKFRLGQIQADLDWLDLCEQTIAAGEVPVIE